VRLYRTAVAAKLYQVGDLALLAKVSVRTLHHYDAIGLLTPTARSGSGYRLYTADDLLRLQQIHIGRSLGMSLEQIRRMLDDPGFDQREALLDQRRKLQARLNDTHAMIAAIDAALHTLEDREATDMNPQALFNGFDPSAFEAEVEARWGDTHAYSEAAKRTSNYTKQDWARAKSEEDALMNEFVAALVAGTAPDHEHVIALAERHRLHIDRWFYSCDPSHHAALAQMYLADPRFTAYFEKYADGLAAFVASAIRGNTDRGLA
jgi:MerR family transcriptional regulator, thiopeptide resistance regulator